MAPTNWQLFKVVARHPIDFWRGLSPTLAPRERRLAVFFLVMAALNVVGFVYYVYASGGLPLWKRVFPWALVWEYLAKDSLTGFEKYQLTAVVALSAAVIMFIKQHSALAFHVGETVFGVAAAWHVMSFEMTKSRPLNVFLLIGASWVVAAGLEGISRYIGIWQEPEDLLPPQS